MPISIKQKISGDDAFSRAVQRRVDDNDNKELSAKEIDMRSKVFLTQNYTQVVPDFRPGQPMSSIVFKEFVKDTKFYIGLINGRLGVLESEIENAAKEIFGVLNDLEREALILDSDIKEEEVKFLHNYTTVHHNAFVRQKDVSRDWLDKEWTVDYKTGFTFMQANAVNVIPGVGATLPLKTMVSVPIVDATLVADETDFGDTAKPILSTDPRNVLFADSIFRHVIIRREHDETSRRYNYSQSNCTFLLELASNQLINHIVLKPVGQTPVRISEISYINEAGEDITLSSSEISLHTGTMVAFEPVRTKFITVKLTQYAPVTRGRFSFGDMRIKKVNEMLRGVGFSQTLAESSEEIMGRIYDFSIDEIKAGLFVFESLGVFRSLPVEVKAPTGVGFVDNTELLTVTTSQGSALTPSPFVIPMVLTEYYIAADLRDADGNVVLRDLLPIPDVVPTQQELLPLVGSVGRLKLFPDFLYSYNKIKVVAATVHSPTLINIETEDAHGLSGGETITVLGRLEHDLNGDFFVSSIVDATNFRILVSSPSSSFIISEDSLPYVYYFEGPQVYPLFVYKGTHSIPEQLTLGTDYQLSIDGGKTWLNNFPVSDTVSLYNAMRNARSGKCYIKILVPEQESIYWVEYRPQNNQFLGNSQLAKLRNGKIVFSEQILSTRGTLSTIFVVRSDNHNSHISPITRNYSLRVRENVS